MLKGCFPVLPRARTASARISKLISEELIDAEFPETSFPAMLLKALLGEPKEAQLTYELLKSLKEGK